MMFTVLDLGNLRFRGEVAPGTVGMVVPSEVVVGAFDEVALEVGCVVGA